MVCFRFSFKKGVAMTRGRQATVKDSDKLEALTTLVVETNAENKASISAVSETVNKLALLIAGLFGNKQADKPTSKPTQEEIDFYKSTLATGNPEYISVAEKLIGKQADKPTADKQLPGLRQAERREENATLSSNAWQAYLATLVISQAYALTKDGNGFKQLTDKQGKSIPIPGLEIRHTSKDGKLYRKRGFRHNLFELVAMYKYDRKRFDRTFGKLAELLGDKPNFDNGEDTAIADDIGTVL
jgi:hypothetical protein